MVALEKLANTAFRPEKVPMPSRERVIANANPSSGMELINAVLINVEIEVVDYQIYFNASFSCVY